MPEPHSPLVGVVMGSKSDWETMRLAADVLGEFGVPHECRVVSAHRTPDWMRDYAQSAESRGLKLIIAGAGGAPRRRAGARADRAGCTCPAADGA